MRGALILLLSVLVVIGAGVGVEAAVTSTTSALAVKITKPEAVPVGASGPCPRVVSATDVHSALRSSARLLAGPPQFGVICWYQSRNGRPVTLVHESLLNGRSATALGIVIDALSMTIPKGVFNCPMSLPGGAVIALALGSGQTVDLWYEDTGCQTLSNGVVTAYGDGPGAAAFTRFETLALNFLPPALRAAL